MMIENEIAKIAYELYLKRGGAAGDPVSDWAMAERIYFERNRSANATLKTDTVAESLELREDVSVAEPKKVVAEPKKVRKPAVEALVKKQSAPVKTVAPKSSATKPAPAKSSGVPQKGMSKKRS